MGTSNFIQWDPATTNADNDATYLADPVRINGGSVGGLLPSSAFNKFAYQNSTGLTALMAMLATKGYTVSDASLSALTSVLQNLLTNADVRTNVVAVTSSASPTFDATHFTKFEIVLTNNVTSSSLVNIQVGDFIMIMVSQGGSGGFTFAWPNNCRGTVDVSTDAGAANVQLFYVASDLNARALAPLMIS